MARPRMPSLILLHALLTECPRPLSLARSSWYLASGTDAAPRERYSSPATSHPPPVRWPCFWAGPSLLENPARSSLSLLPLPPTPRSSGAARAWAVNAESRSFCFSTHATPSNKCRPSRLFGGVGNPWLSSSARDDHRVALFPPCRPSGRKALDAGSSPFPVASFSFV